MNTTPFETVLVANRGEIARRIIRTLRRSGIRSVAVFSDADVDAPHVREADEAVNIGPAAAVESYLRVDAVISAALRTGSQAIHPGYGFLSESRGLAEACGENGIVFIGPGVEALEVMGDKARARDHVAAHGVPVVPGFTVGQMTDAEIEAHAQDVGYPLLIKPSAGGGGKGMEVVTEPGGLTTALSSARRIATAAFGDDAMVVEKLISRPRHIEVQVFGDQHGTVIALGERECTLQRRHQKVMEEAPSAGLAGEVREQLLAAAVRAAQSVDYVGAGTVEFLVDADAPDQFSFIEMNTRLQVEHPVTEAVTGLDLVALQISVAAGGRLPEAPAATGHAVEARIYAESPERGFLPSTGRVLLFEPPRGVRVDAAIVTGSEVTGFYDPMIAKVIAHGPDRATALERLDAALAQTAVLGVDTNIAFLRRLCTHERVVSGDLDTGLIETMLPLAPIAPTPEMIEAAAEVVSPPEGPQLADPLWRSLPGWRLGAPTAQPTAIAFLADDGSVVERGAGTPTARRRDAPLLRTAAAEDGSIWVASEGHALRLRRLTRKQRLQLRLAAQHPGEAATHPEARAPMPGSVVALHVADGAAVQAGDALLSIEAMKMEHPVLAPHDGTVHLLVARGDQVRRDQPVARVTVEEHP